MSIDAKEAIKRMCIIHDRAAAHVGYEYSADCFCGHGGLWGVEGYDGSLPGGYRNEGLAIEFIETAVEEKIARDQSGGSRES